MEDWQKDFGAALETLTIEVEQFFHHVGELVVEVTDELSEALEEIAEEATQLIYVDMEQFWQELFDPIEEIYQEFEASSWEEETTEAEFFLNPKLEPSLKEHPACIGCHHYHGHIYGGNLLVCGMHPYGWDDENCPDWEGNNTNLHSKA